MRRKFNRLTSILIAVTIIFSLLPMNFAAAETTFPDFPTGWSKPAMEAAVANGLISGYEDGTVRPKGNLTRAEMATIITKAFGAVTLADISALTDVKEGSWYYDSVSRAVKMGAIAGRSATEMAPNAAITRQEVFTILARVLVLSNEDTSSLNKFGDASEIASWAAPSMAALTERGYVNGDDLGNANPKDNITREEFSQLMYMAIRTYITERGTHTGNLDGITVIRVSGVTIKDSNVTSDLVIGDGAGTGKVTIENVKVEKRLLVRGGAIAVIRDTELGENVVVNNVNGITYFDNYRDEPVFEGIVENTIAKFKERSTGGGGGGGGGGTPPAPSDITVRFELGHDDADWASGFEPIQTHEPGVTHIIMPGADVVTNIPFGYEFTGWTTDVPGYEHLNPGNQLDVLDGTTNIHITADIQPIQYPIHYYRDINGTVDASPVSTGTYTIVAPKNLDNGNDDEIGNVNKPNYWEYEFVGWFDENDDPISQVAVHNNTRKENPVKVFAKYTPVQYTIEYYKKVGNSFVELGNSDFIGGLEDAYKAYNITTTDPVTGTDGKVTLPAPSKVSPPPGMRFVEWRTNYQDPNSEITEISVSENTYINHRPLKVYAYYETTSSPVTYTIKYFYKVNGVPVEIPALEETKNSEGQYDLPANNLVPSRAGYTFNGKWEDADGNPINKIVIDANSNSTISIFAVYDPIEYDIEYYDGTSLVSFNNSAVYPTKFTIENIPEPEDLPTKEMVNKPGYELVDWYIDAGLTQKYTGFTVDENTQSPVKLYAEFDVVTYNLVFTVDFVPGFNVLPSFNINNLTAVNDWFQTAGNNILDDDVPDDMEFDYWKEVGGSRVDAIDMNTLRDLTLEPVWKHKEADSYTVNYYEIGTNKKVNFKNSKPNPVTYPKSEITTSIPLYVGDDVDPGFGREFSKWKDIQGNELSGSIEVTGTTPDVINVYAEFIKTEYPVKYYKWDNGTTTIPVDFGTNVVDTNYTISKPAELPDGNKVQGITDGYEFDTWVDENGNKITDKFIYADPNVTTDAGTTVYAKFKPIEYKINFYDDGTKLSNNNFVAGWTIPLEYNIENYTQKTLPGTDDVILLDADYILKYWEDENGNEIAEIGDLADITPDSREINLYAVREEAPITSYKVEYLDKNGNLVNFNTLQNPTTYNYTEGMNEIPLYTNLDAEIILDPGYKFEYWKYDGSETDKITIVRKPAANPTPRVIKVYTETSLIPYKAYFVNEAGKPALDWINDKSELDYNAENIPALPDENDLKAPTGYELIGWKNAAGTQVYSLPLGTETEITLYPIFEEKVYTLTFYADYDKSATVTPASGYTLPTSYTLSTYDSLVLPTRQDVVAPIADYELMRWADAYGNEITKDDLEITDTTPENREIFAVWQPEKYTLQYLNAHNDEEPDFVNPSTIKYEYLSENLVEITLPKEEEVTVPRGYTWLGWTYTSGITPFSLRRTYFESIIVDETLLPYITVTLHLEEKVYTVNFTNATFTDTVEDTFSVTSPLTLPAADKVVTDIGKEFIEWQYHGSTVTTISLDDINDSEEAAGEVDITAKYDWKEYSLTLLNDDGTAVQYIDNYVAPDRFTVVSGTALPDKTQVVAPDGMELDKWVVNGQEVTSLAGLVTAETTNLDGFTVYATYKEKEYRVNFVGVTVDPSVQTTFTKSSGTLTFPTGDKVTPELGYKFVKWLRNGAEITGISFNDLTPEEKENGVITITADCPIINYPVKFRNFDDKVTPVQFKSEYVNRVPTSFNVLSNTALPEDGWVVAPDGKEIDKWVDENGTEVSSPLQVTAGLTEDEGLTVYATYKDKEQKTYTVKYYYIDALDNNNWVSLGIDDVYTAQGTYSLPADSEVAERIGYTFTGRWKYLSGNEITEIVIDENSGDEICVFAIYDVNEYNVKFYDEDKVSTPNWNNYNPPKKYTIENLWTLPTENEIIAPSGKEFRYWADKDGNEVRALTVDADTPATLNLYAVYEFDGVYTIEYYFAESTPAKFVAGYTAPTKFTEATVDSVVLPTGDKLDLAGTGYNEFIEWRTDLTNPDTKVESIVLTGTTPTVIKLYAYCMTQYTVKFFEGMTNDEDFYLIGKSPVYAGGKVAAFPDISYFGDEGYAETGEVASVYENNESVYVTRPKKWWYLDENDNLVEFTADTVVNGDMNVYLLSKKFGLLFVFNSTDFPFLLSTAYNDEQRLVDSVKNLGVSGRKQLNTAIALGMMPSFYNKATDKVVDLLEKATVVKEENGKKNVQVLSATFKLSQFVKENMVNTMLKKYLQEVVNNPAELDRIFSMINVADFADQLGIDTIIAGMTDAEIVSLMKSAENRGTVINFIITDLKKTDSAMLDFVIDYVINDASFREDLIDDLIAELKNAEVTSALKSQAIAYIKSQLEDTESAFYDKFVTMVYEDLNSANSVVMEAVVAFVRTNLGANTQAGKDLRKEILTSSMLTTFLSNAKMKEKVIELILADDFINTALDNVEFRTVLVEAIMADADFIDILLASEEFHDYIVDQLHKGDGHDLAKDVEDLINDEDSAFRKHVLDIVKTSDEFKGLFTSHPALKAVVLDEFKWSQFVASDEDLLKFVFQQDGVTGTYSFITRADVEAEIAAAYNSLDIVVKYALTGTNNSYENLTEDQKQVVRNNFFGNDEVKAEILNEVKTKFNSYKADIVDKIAEGKLSEVTDAKALGLIDSLLAEYVTKYIEQQPLHTDAAIDSSIANVIEEILFNFIADLIQGVNLGNAELDAELAGMLAHVDTVKHQFVVDPTPDVVARLKVVVKDYRDTHATQVKQVITNNYQALTDKLVVMINPEHENSVYGKVEEVLISVAETIDSSLISEYVLTLDENSLKETIRKYMKNLTVGDINKYIAAFLNASNDNVEAIKSELRAFITSSEQRATVEGLAKTYINAPENEATIRDKVSDFIDDVDESFVASNRAFIESALMSLDLTEFIDAEFVKEYVAGLDSAGKAAFADKIYNSLMSNDDYTALMKSLLNDDKIVVTKTNAQMVSAVNGVIRSFDFDKVADIINRNATIEKLVNKFGKKFVEPYYEAMLNKYCDRLDAIIAEVEAAADETYTQSMSTTLTLRVDAIEMLKKLYDKAMPKVTDKLGSYGGVYYNDNIYLKYLVEHDIIGAMFDGDASLAEGDFTGYSLKSIPEYYDYLLSLLIVGDDAITWYGDREDGLSQEHYDALYNAIIGKAMYVQEQLDEILADFRENGELPDKIQSIVERVSQINSLITRFEPQINKVIDKYFAADIDPEKIANSNKVQNVLDELLAMDEPIFEIDMLYDILYKFDAKSQAALKKLIDSGKLRKAIDKFYETSAAEIIKGNATLGGNGKVKKLADIVDEIKSNGKVTSSFENVYDMLVVLAEYGIDVFKTAENEKEDIGGAYRYTEDEYTVSFGGLKLSVMRYYEGPGWIY